MRVALLAAAALALAPIAHAQSTARLDDQLALARVAVSEAGLLATEDEIAAIHAVLRARCERCRLLTSARAYSSRVFDARRTDPRAWVAFLDPRGIRPTHWPRGMDWNAYRLNWLHVYELAGRATRGELPHRCDESPVHWGGSVDRERAQRMGLVRVNCGDTRNDFYVLPRSAEQSK
jgi:hypothetical protein